METWSTIEQALLISAIGIFLVFAVLLVLWGMMAALVRVAAPRAEAGTPAPLPSDKALASPESEAIHAARRRAAAVAVAVALALEADRIASAPLMQPAQSTISSWQATIRGNALSRRASAFRRNPPR